MYVLTYIHTYIYIRMRPCCLLHPRYMRTYMHPSCIRNPCIFDSRRRNLLPHRNHWRGVRTARHSEEMGRHTELLGQVYLPFRQRSTGSNLSTPYSHIAGKFALLLVTRCLASSPLPPEPAWHISSCSKRRSIARSCRRNGPAALVPRRSSLLVIPAGWPTWKLRHRRVGVKGGSHT